MSHSGREDLRSELTELREEVKALRLKCGRQEDQLIELRARLNSFAPGRTASEGSNRSSAGVTTKFAEVRALCSRGKVDASTAGLDWPAISP